MHPDDAMAICERVLEQAPGDVEVRAEYKDEALLRFANNSPIQHTSAGSWRIFLRLRDGAKLAEGQTERADEDSLRQMIEDTIQRMAILPEDPEPWPSVGPQPLLAVHAWEADTTPETFDSTARAAACEAMAEPSAGAGLTSAGTCEVIASVCAAATTNGMRGRYGSTSLSCSVTSMAEVNGSGWRSGYGRSRAEVDPAVLGREAAETALRCKHPSPLEPGTYRVVLSAAAAATALAYIAGGFRAKSVAEGNSYLADRLEDEIAVAGLRIEQNPAHPKLQGRPYDDDCSALRCLTLLDGGHVVGLAHDRRTAAAAGCEPTGYSSGGRMPMGAAPGCGVITGERVSDHELIEACGDGLYISRFWYTNWVNPKEAIITGMTRDGTFRIRGGKLAEPVNNARFQCQLLQLLQTCEAVGSDGDLSGIVAPSMLVGEFDVASATLF